VSCSSSRQLLNTDKKSETSVDHPNPIAAGTLALIRRSSAPEAAAGQEDSEINNLLLITPKSIPRPRERATDLDNQHSKLPAIRDPEAQDIAVLARQVGSPRHDGLGANDELSEHGKVIVLEALNTALREERRPSLLDRLRGRRKS